MPPPSPSAWPSPRWGWKVSSLTTLCAPYGGLTKVGGYSALSVDLRPSASVVSMTTDLAPPGHTVSTCLTLDPSGLAVMVVLAVPPPGWTRSCVVMRGAASTTPSSSSLPPGPVPDFPDRPPPSPPFFPSPSPPPPPPPRSPAPMGAVSVVLYTVPSGMVVTVVVSWTLRPLMSVISLLETEVGEVAPVPAVRLRARTKGGRGRARREPRGGGGRSGADGAAGGRPPPPLPPPLPPLRPSFAAAPAAAASISVSPRQEPPKKARASPRAPSSCRIRSPWSRPWRAAGRGQRDRDRRPPSPSWISSPGAIFSDGCTGDGWCGGASVERGADRRICLAVFLTLRACLRCLFALFFIFLVCSV